MIPTLRARLAVISALVFGALLTAISALSYKVLEQGLDADTTTRLTELTEGLHGYLNLDGETPAIEFDESDADEAAFVHEATQYYQVYDAQSGQLLVESPGFAPMGLHLTSAEVQAFRAHPQFEDIATEYGRVRISNSVIAGPGGRTYLLQVGVALAAMDTALGTYRDQLWWRVLAGLAAGGVAAWWLSGFALRPLSALAADVGRIDVSSLQTRLPVRGAGDELDRVATAFNETLSRLEISVEEMRHFSTALAHDLRTPLAALRGEIELALQRRANDETEQRALVSQIEELDKLKRLIDHVLTLARAESGQIHLRFSAVDVGELATFLVEQLEPVAQARGVNLACERSGSTLATADASWLERLLLNLLDNAMKFTPAGGSIVVGVQGTEDGVRLDVRDNGIGMAPEVVEHIFDRFYRADPARSSDREGAGLGLSLVRWIAARHGGTITVASQPGQGSTFRVALPRHQGE
jgi:heavy metal sensor kinase